MLGLKPYEVPEIEAQPKSNEIASRTTHVSVLASDGRAAHVDPKAPHASVQLPPSICVQIRPVPPQSASADVHARSKHEAGHEFAEQTAQSDVVPHSGGGGGAEGGRGGSGGDGGGRGGRGGVGGVDGVVGGRGGGGAEGGSGWHGQNRRA